ncbi:MAG: alpha/beta fold hydrolase [Bacteroidota bacterium]
MSPLHSLLPDTRRPGSASVHATQALERPPIQPRRDPLRTLARCLVYAASLAAPRTLAALGDYLMVRPHRRPQPLQHPLFREARLHDVPYLSEGRSASLRVYEWDVPADSAPTVLLAHGWTLSARSMLTFVQPLRQRGLRVLAVDHPAHGHSSGQDTDFLRAAQALRAVARTLGPIHGAVAHSFGGAAAGCGLLPAEASSPLGATSLRALALLAAPSNLRYVMHLIQAELGLSDRGCAYLDEHAFARFGAFDQHDLIPLIRNFVSQEGAVLVVDDSHDPTVLPTEGSRLAEAAPSVLHHRTEGLGHMGILDDPVTLELVATFIADHAC